MAPSANSPIAPPPSSIPRLAARGEAEAAKVTPFWATFDRMLSDAYCARDNPSGIVNLGIANNSLMEAELLDFFHRSLSLHASDLTYGTSLFGSTRLFAALCSHYNSAAFAPVSPVLPSHLITGPGCGSLLDQVFLHLAGDGDAVLCAAPYYNGFDADLNTRANVTCVPVFSPSTDGTSAVDFSGETALRGFEAALQGLHAKHMTCAAVLLCNPHNPSGRCYDREAMLAYGRFVEKHDLHLVVDEIYALSTYKCSTAFGPDQGFISALNIDWLKEAGCHPGRVHIVSSSSKDWGINGFRVGSLISQHNPTLLKAMMSTAKLYMVSSPSDALFSALLTHPTFYGAFIRTNQARLGAAYRLVTQWLQHHGINYSPANAGHFVLADLERFMPRLLNGRKLTPQEGETALWARALDHRVCVTPGSNYHHPRLGMFRLTFSLPAPAMLEGLSRLERALGLSPWAPPSPSAPISLGLTAAEIDAPLREAALAPPVKIEHFQPEPMSVSKALSPGAQAVVTALCGGMPHLSLQDSDETPETPKQQKQQQQPEKDRRDEVHAKLTELLAMMKTAPCAC